MNQQKCVDRRKATHIRRSILFLWLGTIVAAYSGCGSADPGEDFSSLQSSQQPAASNQGFGGAPPLLCESFSNRLCPGKQLQVHEYIQSNDAKYQFLYQSDGNLVLYRLSDALPLWSSGTAGTTPGSAIMGQDGRLRVINASNQVVYITPSAPISPATKPLPWLELAGGGILMITQTGNPNTRGYWRSGDPECFTGVSRDNACCASSCGTCGGNGCSARPGGSAACCLGSIQQQNLSCGNHQPPCVIP